MAFHDPTDVVAGPPLYGVRPTAATLHSLDCSGCWQFFKSGRARQSGNFRGHRGSLRIIYHLRTATEPSAFYSGRRRRHGGAFTAGGPATEVAAIGGTSRFERGGFNFGQRS